MVGWILDAEDWRSFAEQQAAGARATALLVASTAVTVGVGAAAAAWMLADSTAGFLAAGLIVVVAVAAGAAVSAVATWRARRRARTPGTVLLAERRVVVGGVEHRWDLPGRRLEACSLVGGPPVAIDVVYSVGTARGRRATWLLLPVPDGHVANAALWVDVQAAALPVAARLATPGPLRATPSPSSAPAEPDRIDVVPSG